MSIQNLHRCTCTMCSPIFCKRLANTLYSRAKHTTQHPQFKCNALWYASFSKMGHVLFFIIEVHECTTIVCLTVMSPTNYTQRMWQAIGFGRLLFCIDPIMNPFPVKLFRSSEQRFNPKDLNWCKCSCRVNMSLINKSDTFLNFPTFKSAPLFKIKINMKCINHSLLKV